MASRVAGAVLALTAAALLAVSVIAGAWWSGHPTFNGAEIKAKEITVGPLGATGCNTGGDGACMKVPVDPTFETVGFALVGVTGLLGLTALVLAATTARGAARRKSFAIFVIVGAMVASGLALVLVVVGPKIRTEAPLPFSTGLFVFFGGIASALASSAFAMRNQPPTRMQLAPARQSLQPMPPMPMSPAGFDVQALLAEDALRPSSLGPEPMMGRGSPVQSPGGALPGPSGPLGASGPQPLFTSAPNLRPLYDVAPGQGGTGGFVPAAPPAHLPMRAPTPFSRDQIAAVTGIPTPPEAPRPVTVAGVSAPRPPSDATDRDLLGIARGAKPKSLPPPPRGKTASIAPIPPLVQPRPMPTLATAVPPPPITTASPNLPRLESEDGSFDAMKTYQREPSPHKPEPPKPEPPKPAPRQEPRAPTPRPPTRLLTEDAPRDTDVGTRSIDEPATEPFETSTSESTSFAPKPRAPSISSTMETQAAPPPDDDDEQMTAAREKVAQTDMDLPTVRPPTETSPSTEPAPEPEPPIAVARAKTPPPVAPADEAPTDHEPAKQPPATKLPMSTAPDSLPPPTEKQAAASGPSPACPQCEAPMAWVEAHLRFYCKSCKMYF